MNENELLAARIESATTVVTSFKNDLRAQSEEGRQMYDDAVKFLTGQYQAWNSFPCRTAEAEKPKGPWEAD